MQAYEFNAVVRDGQIQIPKKLPVETLSNVRVIILAETAKRVSVSHTDNVLSDEDILPNHFAQGSRFTAMRLKTKGFTFNREEIHER